MRKGKNLRRKHKHKRHHHRKVRRRKFGMKQNLEHLVELSEDLLRYIKENKKDNVQIKNLVSLCINQKILGRVLNLLENDRFIIIMDGKVHLTQKGEEIAGKLLEKHLAIEKAFQSNTNTNTNNLSTHKIAHILEHMLSGKEIDSLYKYSSFTNGRSCPLDKYYLHEARVHKLNIKSEKLFYKLLSLGIYPGQRIQIENKNSTNQIIKVKGSRFVIDKIIARQIYVLP